eukprot:1968521-Prymnesium_polylepis.1
MAATDGRRGGERWRGRWRWHWRCFGGDGEGDGRGDGRGDGAGDGGGDKGGDGGGDGDGRGRSACSRTDDGERPPAARAPRRSTGRPDGTSRARPEFIPSASTMRVDPRGCHEPGACR